MSWLRPTFRVNRSQWLDHNKVRSLAPAVIAVLEVNTGSNMSRYEVLGCNASPVWVPTPVLASLLRDRGEQL